MGNSPSSPAAGSATTSGAAAPAPLPAKATTMPHGHPPAAAGAECPVDHSGMSARRGGGAAKPFVRVARDSAVGADASASESHSGDASTPEECPVDHAGSGSKRPKVYDVYSREIDPTNMMPSNPNQQPSVGQKVPLSTHRVPSSIPKGGTEETWAYPSPQMFYNALTRKGKGDDVQEEDMATVVAIHNNMNERAWRRLAQWENLHPATASKAKLVRFRGRPDELTPKARLKTWLGYPVPFDRHDWTVQRGDKEVRYVIDYYYDEDLSAADKIPALESENAVKSISMDVRPAVDSIESLIDRLRLFPSRAMDAWNAKKPAAGTSVTATATAAGGSGSGGSEVSDEAKTPPIAPAPAEFTPTQRIQTKCGHLHAALAECGDEAMCANANIALNYCMASVVCKPQAAAFMTALESGKDTEAVFDQMSDCLEAFRNEHGEV